VNSLCRYHDEVSDLWDRVSCKKDCPKRYDKSSRSPTLSEAVDEQHVECGIVLTQSSQ
jgi:hypothetical protein